MRSPTISLSPTRRTSRASSASRPGRRRRISARAGEGSWCLFRPRLAQARIRLLEFTAPQQPNRLDQRARGVAHLFLHVGILVEIVVAGGVRPHVADIGAELGLVAGRD